MGEFSIGHGVTRKEDWRLLTGQGLFLDDMLFGRVLYAVVVRSPYAHAEVNNIDINTALSCPGVNTILTGEDYLSDGLGPIPSMPPYKKRDGSPMFVPDRPAIAIDRVRNIGYPVAVVVAETLEQAKDAAELIEIHYTPLTAVISAYDAFQPGAPLLYDDCPRNESYFYRSFFCHYFSFLISFIILEILLTLSLILLLDDKLCLYTPKSTLASIELGLGLFNIFLTPLIVKPLSLSKNFIFLII